MYSYLETYKSSSMELGAGMYMLQKLEMTALMGDPKYRRRLLPERWRTQDYKISKRGKTVRLTDAMQQNAMRL